MTEVFQSINNTIMRRPDFCETSFYLKQHLMLNLPVLLEICADELLECEPNFTQCLFGTVGKIFNASSEQYTDSMDRFIVGLTKYDNSFIHFDKSFLNLKIRNQYFFEFSVQKPEALSIQVMAGIL